MTYEAHWTGLSPLSWEREWAFSSPTTKVCAIGPVPRIRQTNRLCRRMQIGAAQREVPRNNGERFLAPGHGCVSHVDWLRRYCNTVCWYMIDEGLWQLGKISETTQKDGVYLVRYLDDPGPIKILLSPTCCTTSMRAVRDYGCLRIHLARAFARRVKRNVD